MSNRIDDIFTVIDRLGQDIKTNTHLDDNDRAYYEQKLSTLRDLIKIYSEDRQKSDYSEVHPGDTQEGKSLKEKL
jgi:hypothetical protein